MATVISVIILSVPSSPYTLLTPVSVDLTTVLQNEGVEATERYPKYSLSNAHGDISNITELVGIYSSVSMAESNLQKCICKHLKTRNCKTVKCHCLHEWSTYALS